jgi:hypothetical protein
VYPWGVLTTAEGNVATQLIKRNLKSQKEAAIEIRTLAISLNESESELVGLSAFNAKASTTRKAIMMREVRTVTGGHADGFWHAGDASYVAGRTCSTPLLGVSFVEYPSKAAAEAAAAGEAVSGDDDESGEIDFDDDDGGSGEMEHDGPLDDKPEEELEEELK